MYSTPNLTERKSHAPDNETATHDWPPTILETANSRALPGFPLSPVITPPPQSNGCPFNSENINTGAFRPLTPTEQECLFAQLELADHHREHLAGSGLRDEIIEKAGFRTITAEQAARLVILGRASV